MTETATMSSRSAMTRRDFFVDVVAALRERLPEELAGFRHHTTMNLLKVYYGNERVHYEIWANSQQRTIELGLHFEDGPVSTAAYLAHFDRYIVELKDLLGPSIELEQWTPSWGHLYELLPLTPLDAALAARAAARLCQMIAALQPLVEAAAVPPERSALPQERRGPWRKWRH